MKILLAEDEKAISRLYQVMLEDKGHQVIITDNGQDCLDVYNTELQITASNTDSSDQPFDAVVLDYKMPRKDGMEVAKEILAANSHQRIIFASAYAKEILVDAAQQLNEPVELIQKPFVEDSLVDTIEDKEIYSELQKLNINIDDIKAANLRHEQLRGLLKILKKLDN